jgi:glycerol-3-phosphate dehydrogenase
MPTDNWRTWSTHVIEGWINVNQDVDDEEIQYLIEDMEDELDKRVQEEEINPQWDAREGDRPSWA